MQEFKSFINRGNVVEMAVGLILALYFGAIVQSLVNDILMPPIGLLLGGVDFSELKIILQPEVLASAEGAGDGMAEVAIYYGNFINTVITFLIVSLAIFQIVKVYNNMKERMVNKEQEVPQETPVLSRQEVLLTEIRDLLKK